VAAAWTDNEAVKECCSALYQSDFMRLLLGESFHPGGLALTERAGALLGLTSATRLVDVASGTGASALHLAQCFGCHVTGVDYSRANTNSAAYRAEAAGLRECTRFLTGDAEALPLDTEAYDAALCECALCTFPNKGAAASEFFRLLRPGGRLVVSDVTRALNLPPELESVLGWVACIADARSASNYATLLQEAGLHVLGVESHPGALLDLVRHVQTRLLAAEMMVKLGKIALPEGVTLKDAQSVARAALAAAQDGRLGYTLILAEKPAGRL